MSFVLSKAVNPPTAFLVRFSELSDRFDPEIVLFRRRTHNFKYPVSRLRKFFREPPQYGAGERGMERETIDQPRYVRITDIDEYGILNDALGATAATIEPRYILEQDDLLLARSGNTVGKSYLHKTANVSYPCFFAGYLIRFRFDTSSILPDYVFALTQLPYYKEWVQAVQRAAGQPNINAQEYSNLQIPIPPMHVQKMIIEQLEIAYDTKRSKEQHAHDLLRNIDRLLLDELGITPKAAPQNTIENRIFKRLLSEVTGGRLDPIANQPLRVNIESDIISGKFPSKPLYSLASFCSDIANSISPGVSYIGLENIDGLTGQYIEKKEKKSISSALIFSPGQILFPKLRPYLNKTHLTEFSGLCSTEFHVLDAHGVRPEFLTEFLRCHATVSLTSLLMTGSTLPRLQLADIERLQVPVPPPIIQEQLIQRIAKIRRSTNNLFKDAQINMEESKKSIENMILGEGD